MVRLYACLAVVTVGCWWALLPGPAEATEHCEFVLGFARVRAAIEAAEGPGIVGDCLEPQQSGGPALTNLLAAGICAAAGGWWCAPLLASLGGTIENNAESQVVVSPFNDYLLADLGVGDGSIIDSHAVVRRHPAVLDAIVRTVVG